MAKSNTYFEALLVDHTLLEEVFIFFDTATYDEIEQHVFDCSKEDKKDTLFYKSKGTQNALLPNFPSKVTTEAALGLIAGTMGLLTGFSILRGVEIVYYLLRFL